MADWKVCWCETSSCAPWATEDEAEDGLVGDSARAAVGTASYLAPEVWRSERYSYAVDVWSFGVTLFLALTGKVCTVLTSLRGRQCSTDCV